MNSRIGRIASGIVMQDSVSQIVPFPAIILILCCSRVAFQSLIHNDFPEFIAIVREIPSAPTRINGIESKRLHFYNVFVGDCLLRNGSGI